MARALLIIFDSLRKDVFDRSTHGLVREWRESGTTFERCCSQSGFTPVSFASILVGRFPSRAPVVCTGPTVFSDDRPDDGTVWWNVSERPRGDLVLSGAQPVTRSLFSLFRHRLFALRHSKTNAFAELAERETIESPEHGLDVGSLRQRCLEVGALDDSLIVIRVYDTHLPYGRGISPIDAPSHLGIKHEVARWFGRDEGISLRDEVAVPAFERALDYLVPIWQALRSRLDFAAVMSDHGESWSADPAQVGHAEFLTPSVLHVPLVVVDGRHRGRDDRPCNNVDVTATLTAMTGRPADWAIDGVDLFGPRLAPFCTEANSKDGRFVTRPHLTTAGLP